MQNVRSQPPYHINLFFKAKSKEWRNSWIASNPSAQRHKALKSTVSIAKEIKRKSNVERLVEIPIGYRNSAPHKATPKNGRTLLVDQACTPKEGTLHRLRFFNWKSSTTRSWYRNRPFQPKLSISMQLESKSFLNKWCFLLNPLDLWVFSRQINVLLSDG